MNHFVSLQGFDICRDSPWIGGAAFILFFGASLVFAIAGGGQWNLGKFQFYLAHVIFVPIAVFLTMWCYQHPEQIDNNPDGWMSDMRMVWPLFAIGDLFLIVLFMKSGGGEHAAEAMEWFHRANSLRAAGRYEEADAAYANGRWILDHKCKRQ